MRIGIVTPAIMYGEFACFFPDQERKQLLSLPNNNNVPAPTIIAKGFIQSGHFVRLFTIGDNNIVFHSEKVEIVILKEKKFPLNLFFSTEYRKAYSLRLAIRKKCDDLDVLHSQWTYHTALSTLSFAKKIPTFCTVRDWTPIIIGYLPKYSEKRSLYESRIDAKFLKKRNLKESPLYNVTKRVLSSTLAILPDTFWRTKLRINEKVFACPDVHFIGNSPYTSDLIQKKLGKNVPYIMNPIDADRLYKGEKILPKELKIITIQSMLESRKNVVVLLKAFQLVRIQYPEAQLLFMYSRSLEMLKSFPFYKEWADSGYLKNVRFLCNIPHDQIYQYIDECSMLVHPALEESFGNVIVEGMMRKTPIIGGRNSGAVPYLLGFGERGFICDVASENEIAKTIVSVFNDNKETLARVERAFSWISENNVPSAIIDKHIAIYREFMR